MRDRARGGATIFSSHQLDVVQDLCEEIVMVDHGGWCWKAVAKLRASSGRRQLRLHVEDSGRDWLHAFPGVTVVAEAADDLRLALPAETDPLDVLDAARSAGRVVDFGLDLPTLSQLFFEAAARRPEPAAPA